MRKILQFTTVAIAVMSASAHIAFAQGTGTDAKSGAPARKEAPADIRGPDGFTPQESSPANGGLNVRGETRSDSRSTTGQGAASAPKLSAEQRGKIVAIFRDHQVAPATLDVPVQPGARIAENVRHYPLPPDVVQINPAWRSYNFIMVRDQILVIDPGSRQVVEIFQI